VTVYLLDADVFIQAKNSHYGFDIVPAFWTWLDQAHNAGMVFTVEKIAAEVEAGGDDLATWMVSRPKSFKLPSGAPDQASLAALAAWANGQQHYKQGAVNEFLSSGDYYLIAQAMTLGYTVVTHEVPAPASQNRIKIPDVCNGNGVAWLSPFQMLKDENVKFVL
jgi:hypothetical protein